LGDLFVYVKNYPYLYIVNGNNRDGFGRITLAEGRLQPTYINSKKLGRVGVHSVPIFVKQLQNKDTKNNWDFQTYGQ